MAAKTAAGVLQELAVKAGTTPEYEFVGQRGPQHLALFEIHCEVFGLKGTGLARSKKLAKQECAQALLLKMSRAGHRVPAPFCLPRGPAPFSLARAPAPFGLPRAPAPFCLPRAPAPFRLPRAPAPAPFCLPRAPAPVAKRYCHMKKERLPQTFATNREAVEDGARGIKREGGAGANEAPKKLNKIEFVKYDKDGPSQDIKDNLGIVIKLPNKLGPDPSSIDELKGSYSALATCNKTATSYKEQEPTAGCSKDVAENKVTEPEDIIIKKDYLEELSEVRCVAVNHIAEYMFNTKFGKLVLLVRNWQPRVVNIQTSCQLCGLKYDYHCDAMTNVCTVLIEGKIVAQACGATKKLGKDAVENLAWEVLITEAISIVVKERFIPQDDARISFPDVPGSHQPEPRDDEFGAPVEASVAARMMRLMGWQGGGLGADAQGIAEPVRPHLQIIHRAGLGSDTASIRQIQNAAEAVIKRYIASDCIDVDLVFSSDFKVAERKGIHHVAGKAGLISRSYGQNNERFLVVRKRINVFHLASAIVKKGSSTPKYKIFVPTKMASFYRERD